jgi:hypothetical protein
MIFMGAGAWEASGVDAAIANSVAAQSARNVEGMATPECLKENGLAAIN